MSEKGKCFVVAAIGQPGSDERRHGDMVLNYIIKPVVEARYSVTRGDESGHAGMITVDAINLLLDANLVIADLSFLNPNVFYELGLRHSINGPTIHIASDQTVIPFDNADHRVIRFDIGDWSSHQRAKDRLAEHINALDPRNVTNPITIAKAYKKGKELQETIRDISESLGLLEQKIGKITEMPEKGHITRPWFEEVTEKHRVAILDIVQKIRHRIAHPMTNEEREALPQANSVLQRLKAIEDVMSPRNGLGYIETDPSVQEINGEPN